MTVVNGDTCLASLCARNRSRVIRWKELAAVWRVALQPAGGSRVWPPEPAAVCPITQL